MPAIARCAGSPKRSKALHDHQPVERISPWRLSVAPMMEWTDRHCRYFHRLISQRTRLYTEMVTTGALLHGDVPRHLDFHTEEHPVALQLGGSEPDDLAQCAGLAVRWGYDEVNLNCGCPSPRVQRGAFGACLMNEAPLVRDCVRAMRDAVGGAVPVTVKHRIGLGKQEDVGFVRDFIGTVAEAGCTVFIVHARNAWLEGLSPKDNREIPPLRYDVVHQLKRDFPALSIVLNGGITDNGLVAEQLALVDGVMVGRQAYHDPCLMADWDRRFLGAEGTGVDASEAWRMHIEDQMVAYMARLPAVPWAHVARHMLGLWNGQPGARRWRQVWSDHRHRALPAAAVQALARQAREAVSAAA
ncbi:MAG: tRNA dihydrouridine(20/20a) synthase DusA [Ideonella sp.]|nr:tRNA dihydrouridine(20/20a) synthase DusA [Ideonella sp.]